MVHYTWNITPVYFTLPAVSIVIVNILASWHKQWAKSSRVDVNTITIFILVFSCIYIILKNMLAAHLYLFTKYFEKIWCEAFIVHLFNSLVSVQIISNIFLCSFPALTVLKQWQIKQAIPRPFCVFIKSPSWLPGLHH